MRCVDKNMNSKIYIGIAIFFILTSASINILSSEMLVSDVGVEYDSEIFEAFNESDSVRVIVRLKDNSGINITGSKEERIEKIKQKGEWFKPRIEGVLSELNESEFRITGKLTNDGRVLKINIDRIVHPSGNENETNPMYNNEIEDDVIKFLENSEWAPVVVELKSNTLTNSILSDLTKTEFKLEEIVLGDTAFFGNITQEGLNKLKNNPEVRLIYLNRKLHILLQESLPLINANNTWALGYTGKDQTICVIDGGINC